MRVDCETCEVRGDACDDCVVAVLLGDPRQAVVDRSSKELEAADRAAVAALIDGDLLDPSPTIELRPHLPLRNSA